MIKYCKYCGKQFETKSGTKNYCDNQHYRKCIVCGTNFPITLSMMSDLTSRKTCSRKCTSILRKQTCEDKYGGPAPASSKEVQAKMRSTTKERYGVEVAAQSQEIQDKMKATVRERYGVDYVMQDRDVVERIKVSNQQKYGVDWVTQRDDVKSKIKGWQIDHSDEVQSKMRESYQQQTGYTHPWSNPSVRAKSQDTWKTKYGVDHPSKSVDIQEKIRQTNLEKHGVDNPMKCSDIREKARRTNLEKYGCEEVFSSPEIQSRIHQTMHDRYGTEYYSQSRDYVSINSKIYPEKINEWIEFRDNTREFILSKFDHKPTLHELYMYFGSGEISKWINLHDCQDLIDYIYSQMERDVFEFIKQIDPNANVLQNTRNIISPYELDLYLPNLKLAIECNPTSTHNSSFNMFQDEESPIKYDYHAMKTDLCEKEGIFLFHIFGYEWSHRRNIVQSMIRNLLKKNDRKVYARNTTVKEISSRTAKEFLDQHHRQGGVFSQVNLGLYTKDTDELVSVMTFGMMRNTIGTSIKADASNMWELVRFCNLENTSVIGGASKLFRYFVHKYEPCEVRSFSDRSHTKGSLYSTLGFTELQRSSAGYVWVNLSTDIAYHRYNAQKQNIRKFLHNDSIDLSKTEKQIMESHGFVQVFDSGTITWQWKQ